MKDGSDDGCSVLLSGIVLLVFLWVLTRIVNVFDPELLAHSQLCCTGASVLLFFLLVLDQDALKDADRTLHNMFVLLSVALGAWILAAPAKALAAQIDIWLGMHPQVGWVVLCTIFLGPLLLFILLSMGGGPSTGRHPQRERYHPEDLDGYYDS